MAQSVTTTKIRDVPVIQDQGLRNFLGDLKSVVEGLQQTATPPQPPTNLTATPGPGNNVISFTRSNATNFRLYVSASADRTQAQIVDLGSNASYTDQVGQAAIKKWYWVEAVNSTSVSTLVGPATGATLALTAPAATTAQPPQSAAQTFDTTINQNRPIIFGIDRIHMPRQQPLADD